MKQDEELEWLRKEEIMTAPCCSVEIGLHTIHSKFLATQFNKERDIENIARLCIECIILNEDGRSRDKSFTF